MKKFLFTIFLNALFGCLLYAAPTYVPVKISKSKGNVSNGILKAPINLPIELTFDDATGELSVSAPEDLEGCVYVFTLDGEPEGYSPTLNATFTISQSGIHVISLQGDDWVGEAKISY